VVRLGSRAATNPQHSVLVGVGKPRDRRCTGIGNSGAPGQMLDVGRHWQALSGGSESAPRPTCHKLVRRFLSAGSRTNGGSMTLWQGSNLLSLGEDSLVKCRRRDRLGRSARGNWSMPAVQFARPQRLTQPARFTKWCTPKFCCLRLFACHGGPSLATGEALGWPPGPEPVPSQSEAGSGFRSWGPLRAASAPTVPSRGQASDRAKMKEPLGANQACGLWVKLEG